MIKDPMERLRETEQRILALETILGCFIVRLALAQPDPEGQIQKMKSDVLRLIASAEPDVPPGDDSFDVLGNSHSFAAMFFDDAAKTIAVNRGG